MRLSNKQKAALETISGKPWDSFHPDAVKAYFAFTDRGQRTAFFDKVFRIGYNQPPPGLIFNESEQSLWDLMQYHKIHPYDVECWKRDFLSCDKFPPQLFLWDFFEPQIDYEKWREQGYPEAKPTFMYPDAFIKHAFEIYKEVRGYIPIDDISGCKEWAERLGVAL